MWEAGATPVRGWMALTVDRLSIRDAPSNMPGSHLTAYRNLDLGVGKSHLARK
jgi:hypothetical protein